jgi:hypothetical protein
MDSDELLSTLLGEYIDREGWAGAIDLLAEAIEEKAAFEEDLGTKNSLLYASQQLFDISN